MRALVIGAGGVGKAIANIASRRDFITEMVIADHELRRAEEAAARVEDNRFIAAKVDAGDVEQLRELIRKVKPDIVVNAVDPRFVMSIFRACEVEGQLHGYGNVFISSPSGISIHRMRSQTR